MKKNILTVVILVLVLANMVLTAIMMFTVLPSAKKTDKMITDICSILDLELASENKESASEKVDMKDVVYHELEEPMTLALKKEGNEDLHYLVINVSVAMNTKDKGYKTYDGENIVEKEGLIKSAITSVVSQYTFSEAQESLDEMQNKILKNLQETFDSKFIYQILFSDVKIQ